MAQQDEYSETLAKIIQQYQELGRLLPETQIQQAALASGFPKVVQGMLGVGTAAKHVTGAFTDAAGAMYRGEKGMKAFNGAIDKTATALSVLAGVVSLLGGPMVKLAAGLIAVIGATAKYAKAANEQSDQLYDAFQQMSRSGGAAADGLQGLYVDVQRLGGGIQDLGDFVSLVAANAGEFALFAGSVYEGRREFARLGKEMEPYRASLMKAGMTQKEINEATAGYIRLQSRIGLTQNRSTAELAESTRKYLLEQDALTKLLGMSRKEQEDQREAVRNREIFAAKTLALRNAGQDKAADALETTFLMLSKDSKEVGDGFADIVSGNLRTEAAQKLMRTTQGEALSIQEDLSNGQITAAQAADRMAQAIKRTLDTYGTTQGVLGNFNATFTDLAGAQRIVARQMSGGFERQLQQIERNNKRQGIFNDKAMDEELERQTSLRLTQVNAMQNMQDFVRFGVNPATKAMEYYAKVTEYITGLLPGSGKFREEYEAEKRDTAAIAEAEKKLGDAAASVISAEEKFLSETAPEKVEAAKLALDAAKLEFENAKKQRDLLKQQIEARKRGPTPGEAQAPVTGQVTDPTSGAFFTAEQQAEEAARLARIEELRRKQEQAEKNANEAEAKALQTKTERDHARAKRLRAAANQAFQELHFTENPQDLLGDSRMPGRGSAPPGAPRMGSFNRMQGAAPPAAPAGGPDQSSVTSGQPPRAAMAGTLPGVTPVRPEQAPVLSAIRQMIADVESFGGNYNVVYGGQQYPLTTMTITEILNLQRQLVAQGSSGAAGKYQIIPTTLSEIAPKVGLGMDDKFDERNQDMLADYLIRRRGFDQYARGPNQQSKERFLANLAKEWAGLPGGPDGRSYYAGVGPNKSGMGWQQALAKFADGGIVKQPTYAQIGESGPEAIIPLKNGAVPVMLSGNQEVVDAMKSIVSEFKSAMQGMIDRMPRADDVDVTAESLRVLQQIESANRGASDALSQLVRLAQN